MIVCFTWKMAAIAQKNNLFATQTHLKYSHDSFYFPAFHMNRNNTSTLTARYHILEAVATHIHILVDPVMPNQLLHLTTLFWVLR